MFVFKKQVTNRRVTKRGPLYHSGLNLYEWTKRVVLVAAVLGSVVGIYEFSRLTPYLKVNHVEVTGDLSHLTREGVLQLAQVPMGQNLFMVNLYRLGQNIKRFSWVAHVDVRRELPEGLIITVVEHKPVALLETEKARFLVSDQGVVFLQLESGENSDLPLITGFEEEKLRRFPTYFKGELQAALKFVSNFEQVVGNTEFILKRVHYQAHDGWTAFLKKQELCGETQCAPIEIFFGGGDPAVKFENLVVFLDTVREKKLAFKKLDLHVSGKIFARM